MKPLSPLTKSESQRIHARRRFQERKNIDFTSALHREVVGMIRSRDPRTHFVERQSKRITVWDVLVLDVPCRVVYDGNRGNIVTVFPGCYARS